MRAETENDASAPKLISTPSEITELVAELRKHDIIAFDTEFIRESTFFPIVEIIQVATRDKAWIVDAQAFKKGHRAGPAGGFDAGIRPLLEVFEDESILKILHAAQGDQECLYTSFGVVAKPTLDTAVAASLCGYGEGIGLGKLFKSALGIELTKGHARTNWSVRPLPRQLIDYALADVDHLVELGTTLIGQLEKLGRKDWAMQLSSKWEDKTLYDPAAEDLARKLAKSGRFDRKGLAALIALVRWREQRVRELNLPRRWVADDAVLVDLAHVKPKDLEHLSAFRGLNKGEIQKSGEKILAALKAEPLPEQEKGPRKERFEIPTSEESQAVDLLQCFVGILADRHRISARHVLTAGQLLPLVRKRFDSAEQFVEEGLLSEPAARLVGPEIIDFLHGRLALSMDGAKIKITRVED